jgi:hypothetical protein
MCQSDVIDLNIKEVESKLNGENDVKLKEKEKEISEIVHEIVIQIVFICIFSFCFVHNILFLN